MKVRYLCHSKDANTTVRYVKGHRDVLAAFRPTSLATRSQLKAKDPGSSKRDLS